LNFVHDTSARTSLNEVHEVAPEALQLPPDPTFSRQWRIQRGPGPGHAP